MSNHTPTVGQSDTTLDLSAIATEHADNPTILALLSQIEALEAKAQRSPRQKRTFSDKWDKRLNTPIDKMPLGYQLAAQWLIDEGHIDESQSGLFYAMCWAYQCEEGKAVRHEGGASREALKAAREALEAAAFSRMTAESVDTEAEDTEAEDEDNEVYDADIDGDDTEDVAEDIESEDDDTEDSDIESEDEDDSEGFDFDSVEDED